MARPQKAGLDYFALDVKMDDESTIIEAEHGLAGFAIMIKLFQKIYAEGYFYDWTEREQILFSKRIFADREQVEAIVADCIKWGIFNQELYDKHQILSSRRIQEHYVAATYKRAKVELVKEYLLIETPGRKNIDTISITDDGNEAATKEEIPEERQEEEKPEPEEDPEEEPSKQPASKPKKLTATEKRFNEFWAIYPRKIGKKKAFESWKRSKIDKDLHEKILEAVNKARLTEQWTKEKGRYIPNPATWLNQGRWDDEYEEVETYGSNSQHNRKHRDGPEEALPGFEMADEDAFGPARN